MLMHYVAIDGPCFNFVLLLSFFLFSFFYRATDKQRTHVAQYGRVFCLFLRTYTVKLVFNYTGWTFNHAFNVTWFAGAKLLLKFQWGHTSAKYARSIKNSYCYIL